jgi:hypothetical protein
MQQNFAANKRNKKISIIQRLEKSKAQKEKPTHTAFQALSTMKNQFSKDVTKLN